MSPMTEELARLDELIRDLDDRMDTPQGLVREHLTAARSSLIGSMPEEYKLALELARENLPLLDEPLRSRIDEFLNLYSVK
jgi:hypothetical protein